MIHPATERSQYLTTARLALLMGRCCSQFFLPDIWRQKDMDKEKPTLKLEPWHREAAKELLAAFEARQANLDKLKEAMERHGKQTN